MSQDFFAVLEIGVFQERGDVVGVVIRVVGKRLAQRGFALTDRSVIVHAGEHGRDALGENLGNIGLLHVQAFCN